MDTVEAMPDAHRQQGSGRSWAVLVSARSRRPGIFVLWLVLAVNTLLEVQVPASGFRDQEQGTAVQTLVRAAAEQPRLAELLDRLATYLLDYEQRLSALVAEEQYTQTLRTRSGTPAERVLQSDYVLVRLPAGLAWLGFRDTYLVDGQPVRDRDSRLERLFRDGDADAMERARRLVDDSARYNLGDDLIHRTINGPTLTLDLLHRRYRTRFSYRLRGQDIVDGRRVSKIDFEERERPPIIKTPAGDDQVTRGAAWVDPIGGAVLKTYLNVIISPTSQAKVTVSYRPDAGFGFLVPSEMNESYRGPFATITGVATYTNFRRFQTSARIIEQ